MKKKTEKKTEKREKEEAYRVLNIMIGASMLRTSVEAEGNNILFSSK